MKFITSRRVATKVALYKIRRGSWIVKLNKAAVQDFQLKLGEATRRAVELFKYAVC